MIQLTAYKYIQKGKYWLFLKNLDRKIIVMDETWDRKSFEVGGHWPLWG